MRPSISVIPLLAVSSPAVADGIVGSLLHQLTSLGNSAVEEVLHLPKNAPQTNPPFDASAQLVDVTGVHQWIAPGPNDERGPCPGLNALANHGYLPRSGYATIFDLTSATTEVFNMGLDLAAVLSAYGAFFDGVGTGWSIGGQQHIGIGGSRGNYETDSSPTRGNLYQYGSNTDLVMSQFKELFDMQPDPETASYDLGHLFQFRDSRFHQSIANDPYFYYGPFSGIAVSQAAYTFIYRFMANHTAEHPAGILNQEVLKSFFGIEGSGDDLTWTAGHERIPDNWFRRADGDAYGLFQLGFDTDNLFAQYPALTSPGCNQGRVNSYVVINNTDTDPNHYDFSKPNQAVCYGLTEALTVLIGDPAFRDVEGVVQEVLTPIKDALGCVSVPSLNETLEAACAGYSFWGGPTAEIAKGVTSS